MGTTVTVRCSDARLAAALIANFSAFRAATDRPQLVFDVQTGHGPDWEVLLGGQCVSRAESGNDDLYAILYDLEKALTLELQRFRSDLYFVHAAALERGGGIALLIAASGTGKSTTTWALAQQGFGYMSDELAAIHPETLEVHPYPHALCLKAEPPAPYLLPEGVMRTKRTLHLPVSLLPSGVVDVPVPLRELFFLERLPGACEPGLRQISAAEAGARLYANTLNALAHPGFGLDAAMDIAASVPAWHLELGDLQATCEAVTQVLERSPGTRR